MPSPKHIAVSLLLLFSLYISKLRAQDLLAYNKSLGFNAGLNLAFGTHFQRLGFNLNFFYVNAFFQANSEVRLYYNLKSLGPKLRYPELVLAQGVVFGYGSKTTAFNPFLSSVSNQTAYKYSVGYSYNAWFNRRKTTQQTGILALQFDKISLITENDILARKTLDRFRTAAFLVQYQYEDLFQAAVNCSMWTGSMGRRQEIASPEFMHSCYMDTLGGVYPNTSHGLLSLQVKYMLPYSQSAQLNAGIDAEQVRNAVQNKFIHDMGFIPKKWQKTKNCHIPMIDRDGKAYLYKPGQEIRKAKLYLNAFSNANVFY